MALPREPVRRLVDGRLAGYLLINGCTFLLDLGLLTLLHGHLGWPLPVAITLAYVTAFAVSFVLNRRLNFRSHAPVGPQVRVYAVVVAINFLLWVLGAADGLAALGVEYQLARVVAGGCEAIFMYLALRWVVFADVSGRFGAAPRERSREPH